MEMRKLGNTSLSTAPVVFGGNVLGWTLDEQKSFRILDRFVDLGFNTIDTADVYSRWVPGNEGGESETIIGKWLKNRSDRDRITVITKVGSDMGQGARDISEQHIVKAVEDSLRRLDTETIDLYLTHWDDDKTPVEETLGAYQKLIAAGKVKYIGASNLSPARLNDSLAASAKLGIPRYEVFQPEYNLFDREGFENGTADLCREAGLGVITYYSLASGFLSGKYRSREDLGKSPRGAGVEKYLNDRGFAILAAMDKIAGERGVKPAAIALAWLIQNPRVTAPIASATKPEHVDAFREAAELSLTADELASLDAASKNNE